MVSFLVRAPVAALFVGTALFTGQSVGAVKAIDKPRLHIESPYVVTLNSSNWKEVVEKSQHAVFVNIGRTECIHCQNFAPVWEKFAKSVDGLATVAYWDIKERNRPQIIFHLKA